MTTRGAIFFLLVLHLAARSSHAALYQFTLEGEVTYTLLPTFIDIGDPVTIRYVVDSTDTAPDPTVGFYAATGATMEFPNTTLMTPDTLSTLRVSLNGNAVEIVQYLNVGPMYGLSVGFVFPDGTIQSDALPLKLPLTQANSTTFLVFPAFTEAVRGHITSYSSVEVPEPALCPLLSVMVILAARCRSQPVDRLLLRHKLTVPSVQGGDDGTSNLIGSRSNHPKGMFETNLAYATRCY